MTPADQGIAAAITDDQKRQQDKGSVIDTAIAMAEAETEATAKLNRKKID